MTRWPHLPPVTDADVWQAYHVYLNRPMTRPAPSPMTLMQDPTARQLRRVLTEQRWTWARALEAKAGKGGKARRERAAR